MEVGVGGGEGVGREAGEGEGVGGEVKGGRLFGEVVRLMLATWMVFYCPYACHACCCAHPSC